MATQLYPETNIQFLARMLLVVREGHQMSKRDAMRLTDLANFGPGPVPTVLAEGREDGSRPLDPSESRNLVRG